MFSVMAGIYVHIPFCKKKCVYCDFYSVTATGLEGALCEGIVRELSANRNFFADGEVVRTVYFGGGTPSLLAPDVIGGILSGIREHFDFRPEEITIEANPDDLSTEYLSGLVANGVNRISIGIQSFSDTVLRFMRRRHNAAQAGDAVAMAREAGFRNISIDLIYGIPGMDLEEWKNDLRTAAALGVEHISAYHLTFEPSTPLGRMEAEGKLVPVSDDSSSEQFVILHNELSGAGFEHYEISNFAVPGYRSRHNSSYWSGEAYLGVGPSAHSFDGRIRRWVAPSVKDYVAALGCRELYTEEHLTMEDKYNEYIMTGLRTAEGISLKKISSMGVGFERHLEELAPPLLIDGLLHREGDRLFIPWEKFLVSDGVISSLFIA